MEYGQRRSRNPAILAESASIRPPSPKGIDWRRKWIEIFLSAKRDEGLLFSGDLMDPHALDRIQAAPNDSNRMNRR
jgi:hypothetical protein